MKLSETPFAYYSIRALFWPISLLPYRSLRTLGKWAGTAVYYAVPKFRKRALSNLALASSLKLTREEIIATAKGALQNVMITCLEYPKLSREKDISRIAYCENPDEAMALLDTTNKGIIFFCGHQANWEILFLEGTSRMPGVAIGRPTRNKRLYRWVVSIREKFGGTIIEPKNAVREGLRALKRRCFLGIVGDQGMPAGGYVCNFFGRPAFTSPLPAILAYRTGVPLLVATVRRESEEEGGRYAIRYSRPLYADTSKEMEPEVDRLMREALDLLAASILENPSQWLWQHNRWKQQCAGTVKRPYRFDAVRVLLPEDAQKLQNLAPHIATLRAIYPTEHFTVAAPKGASLPSLPGAHIQLYERQKELLQPDFTSKIVFNFTESPTIAKRYRGLAVFKILTLDDLYKIARMPPQSLDFSELFYKVLRYAR